jgi:hypothetical protein
MRTSSLGSQSLERPSVNEDPPCAFDGHLIGIDPDFPIHVSDRLLESHHGLFLQLGLKGIAGKLIDRPNRIEDRPERDRLAIRFEQFERPDTLGRTRGMR